MAPTIKKEVIFSPKIYIAIAVAHTGTKLIKTPVREAPILLRPSQYRIYAITVPKRAKANTLTQTSKLNWVTLTR